MSSSMGAEIVGEVGAERDGFTRECSMCGDVGFSSELFQCKKCGYRWQHTYCSRLYPKIGFGSGNWVCDWCFAAANARSSEHRGDQPSPTSPSTKAKRKASKLSPSSTSSSQMQQQWDAFEYLLEVAQTASFNDGEICCVPVVERQACSSKRTCARKLSSSSSSNNNNNNNNSGFRFNSRQQQQQESSQHDHASHPKTDFSKKNFLVAKTRYKLLSDM